MTEYQFVLNQDVVQAFRALSGRDRAEWVWGFETLAENPHQAADSTYHSASGRPMKVRRFERWRITYWIDDAVCEVRITDVKRASLVA